MMGVMTAFFEGVGVFGRRRAQKYVRMVRAPFGKVVVELGPEGGQQQQEYGENGHRLDGHSLQVFLDR